MKNLLVLLISVLSIFGIGGNAMAGATGYSCVVSHEIHLDESGLLKAYPRPLEVGKKFAVNRSTGALTEVSASFWSSSDAQVSVHAKGNSENSFVASYVAPSAENGVNFTLLRIEEHAASYKKPFLLSSGAGVYSGVCE